MEDAVGLEGLVKTSSESREGVVGGVRSPMAPVGLTGFRGVLGA